VCTCVTAVTPERTGIVALRGYCLKRGFCKTLNDIESELTVWTRHCRMTTSNSCIDETSPPGGDAPKLPSVTAFQAVKSVDPVSACRSTAALARARARVCVCVCVCARACVLCRCQPNDRTRNFHIVFVAAEARLHAPETALRFVAPFVDRQLLGNVRRPQSMAASGNMQSSRCVERCQPISCAGNDSSVYASQPVVQQRLCTTGCL
jgi:hypothetical protein